MTKLHGLIQHSFALRVPSELRPVFAREGVSRTRPLLQSIFAPRGGAETGFLLGDAEMTDVRDQCDSVDREVANGDALQPWRHSVIVDNEQTRIVPFSLPLDDPEYTLPGPFSWAEEQVDPPVDEACEGATGKSWRGFVFGGDDKPFSEPRNDFLLEPLQEPSQPDEGVMVSRFLCQLLANRRSYLFGLPVARNTYNVLLPHARLGTQNDRQGEPGCGCREPRPWIAQPAVSLFYVRQRRGFRPLFSFSVYLVPFERTNDGRLGPRPMGLEEIRDSVKTVWPLATAYQLQGRPSFAVSGPLVDYLDATASAALGELGLVTGKDTWQAVGGPAEPAGLTLRKFTEAVFFALTAQMTSGPGAPISRDGRRVLGDLVLSSLSASRVSAVSGSAPDRVDEGAPSPSPESRCHHDRGEPSKALTDVVKAVSCPLRVGEHALRGDDARLDRDFFDRKGFEIAVLPADRCLIAVGEDGRQRGVDSSILLDAGRAAFMVSGAAAATGMIRSIFREIARSDRSRPDQIADIEREAMIDLHETYDLEITVESYRHHYQRLREMLKIDAEYEALSAKLEALHRETSTRSEARAQRQLAVLTWAIVILSAVIAAGTLVLIFRGG